MAVIRMAAIEYVESDEKGIDLIRPLWEQLVAHHRARTVHFQGYYDAFTFEKRKGELREKARNGSLHIGLAKEAGRIVGYCVCSLATTPGATVGEVDSIFVDAGYRSRGIGDALMRKANEWMDRQDAGVKRISVAVGNEEVFAFYAKYGYYPKNIVLEQIRR